MNPVFIENPHVTLFKSFTEKEIQRDDLGVKNFREVQSEILHTKLMIEEMIEIAEESESFSILLINQILSYVQKFNSFAESIKTYNIDTDPSNFQNRTRIIQSIKEWYNSLLQGYNNNDRIPVNFLQLYNYIKFFSLTELENHKSEIIQMGIESDSLLKKSKELITTLQAKASSESVQDYAMIFQNQSEKYSKFTFKIKPFDLKFGGAEIWLFVSSILIFSFTLLVYNINSILPIDYENGKPSVITLELLTRFLILSFSIFIITFSLKQYNVQKHLYTLNRHRQNTLNSFRLFIDSLDQNDVITRNALMLEVAKAIYESGQSGYISGKDVGDVSPSVIEMTRFVNK